MLCTVHGVVLSEYDHLFIKKKNNFLMGIYCNYK